MKGGGGKDEHVPKLFQPQKGQTPFLPSPDSQLALCPQQPHHFKHHFEWMSYESDHQKNPVNTTDVTDSESPYDIRPRSKH